MPGDVVEEQTPDPLGESTSHMVQKSLELIDTYRKSARTPLIKASTIQDITTMLTSGMPEQFSEAEVNDALRSYLKIIEQHDRSIEAASVTVSLAHCTSSKSSIWGPSRGFRVLCSHLSVDSHSSLLCLFHLSV
jgi:hypothetical protein